MSRLTPRPLFALLAVVVLAGCIGGGNESNGPLDPAAMDAALNELGDEVTGGSVQAVSTDDCPVLATDDLLDALTDEGVLDDAGEDGSDFSGVVRGPWGNYSVLCRGRGFEVEIRNGGPDDRDELIEFVRASRDGEQRELEPVEVEGLDEAQTYEVRDEGETQRVGWIDDELRVEVSIRRDDAAADTDVMASALVTVLGMLDDEYGETETIDRPDEPPIDLVQIRDGLRSLGGDVDDLRQGDRLETCPLVESGDVADLAERIDIDVDVDDLEDSGGYVTGSNAVTDVTVQCGFDAGGVGVSVGAVLVDFDGLDELERVIEAGAGQPDVRSVDVSARADGLPDDAVYSLSQGDDVVGVGVLSGEVLVQLVVARGDVDASDLLTQLPDLVDVVSSRF